MQREVAEVKAVRAFTRIIFSPFLPPSLLLPPPLLRSPRAKCFGARVQPVSESIKSALPTDGRSLKEERHPAQLHFCCGKRCSVMIEISFKT